MEQKLSKTNIKYEVNTFNPGERDFRIAIEKSKVKGFTNFIQTGFPPERDIILKQLKETGVSNENIYSFGLDLSKPIDAYSGIKAVSYNQGTDDFIQSIQQDYHIDNVFGSAVFYDFVNLMIDGYESLYNENEKPSAEKIASYVHNKKEYKCASGNCVVNDNGFILNQPILRKFADGKWQRVEE